MRGGLIYPCCYFYNCIKESAAIQKKGKKMNTQIRGNLILSAALHWKLNFIQKMFRGNVFFFFSLENGDYKGQSH